MTQGIFTSFLPQTGWKATPVSDLPSWADARRVCVDVETRDDHLNELGPGVRRGGFICGVSFAIEGGPAHYLPVRHEGGGNLAPETVFAYLRDQARAFRGEVVGANLGYDLDYLWQEGVPIGEGGSSGQRCRDVLVAAPVLDQLQHSYSLENVATRAGLPGKDEGVLQEALAFYGGGKENLWRLPAACVGAYAERDARLPLQLLERQERQIDADELWPTWNLESDVLPALVRMRRRGVRVDVPKVHRISAWCGEVIAECLAQVKHATGISLGDGDLDAPAALAPALLKVVGDLPRTEKTGAYSVTKDVLKQCGAVGRAIMRAREFHKLRDTFCAQIFRYLVGDRIHCTIRQLKGAANRDDDKEKGTAWGRTSAVDPNLQQQPTRHKEFGKIWRSIFIADEGGEWVCSDWSQQEPRWGVHYAELLRLDGAREFADAYRKDPSLDIHQHLTDIANDPVNLPRGIMKQNVNGRLYGMGDLLLCYECGWPVIPDPRGRLNKKGEPLMIPAPESQAKIDQIHSYAPWLKGLTKVASKRAADVGYVRTAHGRICRFPLVTNEKGEQYYDWTGAAFSRVGQGTAADQFKLAAVEADRAGIPVQLPVHDEFDFTDHTGLRQARELREIQLTALPCRVPHQVDVEVGPSWGELEKVEKKYGPDWGRAAA